MAYVMRDFPKAVRLLSEVIRQAPTVPSSYNTIGLIFEESGDIARALQYYLIAAHLSRGDADLWRRTGYLSCQLNLREQATYCFSKALQLQPSDLDTLRARSHLYQDSDDLRRAADGFRAVLSSLPNDLDAARSLVAIHKANNEVATAIAIFMPIVRHHIRSLFQQHQPPQQQQESTERVSMADLELLADLLLLQPNYEALITTVSEAAMELFSATRTPVPPSLHAKVAIAHIHLGNMDDAQLILAPLSAMPTSAGADDAGSLALPADVARADTCFFCRQSFDNRPRNVHGYWPGLCADAALEERALLAGQAQRSRRV